MIASDQPILLQIFVFEHVFRICFFLWIGSLLNTTTFAYLFV